MDNVMRRMVGEAIVQAFASLCSREWHLEINGSVELLRKHTGQTRNVRVSSRVAYLERCCTRCGVGIRVTQAQALKLYTEVK